MPNRTSTSKDDADVTDRFLAGVDVVRRAFLVRAGAATAAALAVGIGAESLETFAQVTAPTPISPSLPRLKAPVGACDCHFQVYDPPRFPPVRTTGAPFQATGARLEDYQLLQRRLGLTRAVVLTGAAYATQSRDRIDNRSTLDAIRRLAPDARGVVLLPTGGVSATDLQMMTDGGVRGVRVNADGAVEVTARQVAAYGWHTLVNFEPDEIVAFEDTLGRLPTPIVFDHMGGLYGVGTTHRAFTIMRRLIDEGNAWVMLDGADQTGTAGVRTTDYSRATTLAQAFLAVAPERMLWALDWPHPGRPMERKPDDVALFDLVEEWAPNEATRHRLLVENPEVLYGFTRA